MLTCQQNDKKEEVLIESRGLRVEPVPVVEDYELNWEPSGLDNPNSWRTTDGTKSFKAVSNSFLLKYHE